MGTETVTSARDPWAPIQPYFIGNEQAGIPGVLQNAASNYANSGWTPAMQDVSANYVQALQQGNSNNTNLIGQGTNLLTSTGANINAVGNTQQPGMVGANQINAQNVNAERMQSPDSITGVGRIDLTNANAANLDLQGAFGGLGSMNPTQAYQQMLSGRVNTSALDPVVGNAARRMTDQFNEQVMPGINQGATAAGQYGSSRQGIAQGIAARGLSQSLGDMSANMYNNAFNTAQGQMGTAAGQMSNLGFGAAQTNAANTQQANLANAAAANAAAEQEAQRQQAAALANQQAQMTTNQFNAQSANQMGLANAGNDLTAQTSNASMGLTADTTNAANQMNTNQFNANLGLQNNAQNMSNFNLGLGAQSQGANMIGMGQNGINSTYGNTMAGLNANNTYNNANLNQYSNLINQAAGQGGTASNPMYTNTAANNLGLATGAVGLAGAANSLYNSWRG